MSSVPDAGAGAAARFNGPAPRTGGPPVTTTEPGRTLGDVIAVLPGEGLAIGLAVGGLLGAVALGRRRWRR